MKPIPFQGVQGTFLMNFQRQAFTAHYSRRRWPHDRRANSRIGHRHWFHERRSDVLDQRKVHRR